ncbi:PKD-like domain-containing protein [Tenacibaculum sp. ZS6-P6]|uniref:PKD-like domain-containing protein n=1 Tax=Tenacibaculum sp. ZS6-P6 TaxID=3447503 RepID=UPI003F9C8450
MILELVVIIILVNQATQPTSNIYYSFPSTTSSGTTYYQVIVSDTGTGCNSVTSLEAVVIVNQDPTITAQPLTSQTICVDATPSDLSVTATGGVDGLSYQWQSSSTSGTGFTNISGATNSTYTPSTTSSGTTYYQVIVSDTGTGCNSVTSLEAVVIVNQDPTITAQPLTSQTICVDATPSDLSVTATGGVDGLSYQWQSSSTSGTGFTNISGATNSTYTPSTTSSGTTYYQVIVSDTGAGCNSVTSLEAVVIVNQDPTITAQPLTSQTICVDATPSDLSVTATGGVDGLSYQWQSSSTSGTGFNNISGATNSTYTPSTTSSGTTYYQVIVSDTGAGCNSVTSLEAVVTVNQDPTITAQPLTSQTICVDATPSDLSVTATGGVDGLSYQWQSSSTSGTGFTNISGATNSTYTPSTTSSGTTYYQVIVSDTGAGCNSVTSLETVVIVNQDPTITAQPLTSQTICVDATPSDLSVTATGGVDGLTYQWQSSSTSGTGFTNISGATNSTYTPSTTSSGTTYYQVIVSDTGAGCNSVTSLEAVVIVNQDPTITAQPLTSQTICVDATPSDLSVTATGGVDGLTYQWQSSSTSGTGFTNISGATNSTYTPSTTSSGTTYYQVIVSDTGAGCNSVTSLEAVVFVNQDPQLISLTTNSQICEGENAEFTIIGSPNTELTYNINGNPNQTILLNGSGTVTITETSATSNVTINLISLEIPSTGCSINLTNTDTVTVNPNPTLATHNNIIVCDDMSGTQSLNANDAITLNPNTSVVWYDAITGGNIVASPIVNTTSLSTDPPTSFFAQITNTSSSCVNPLRQEVKLQIVSPPFPDLTESTCSNQALNIGLSFQATYTVSSDDPINVPPAANRTTPTIANITDTYVNTTENPVTITYTVTIDDQTTCNGETFDVIVNVNPEPLNNTNPNDIICSGDPLNHDLTNDVNTPGTTFNWIADDNPNISGETISGGNNSTINDILTNTSGTTQNVVYTITPTSPNGCVGDPFVYTVTINPEPFNANTSMETICSNTALNHNLNEDINLSGSTFNWIAVDNPYISGESLINSSSSTIKDILINTSGTTQIVEYLITPVSSSGCNGNPYTFSVTVNPEPFNIIEPIITICSSGTLNHNLNANINLPGSTFNWSAINNPHVTGETITSSSSENITDTLINTSGTTQTVVYNIQSISPTGCTSNNFTYTVTVNPEPLNTNPPTNIICSNTTLNHDLSNDVNITNTSFVWSAINNPNVIGETTTSNSALTITDTLINTSDDIQTVTYIITPTSSNDCLGGSYTYTVTINPEPYNSLPLTETVCSNTNLNLDLSTNINLSGTTFSWVANDNGFVTGETTTESNSSIITDTLINISGSPQTVTYTITPISNNGCAGTPFTYAVTINPAPLYSTLTTETICSNTNLNHDLSTNINLSGTTFNWSATDNPNITGETLINSSSDIIGDTLINTSNTTQTIIYTVTPISNDGCIGSSFTHTVYVDPLPEFVSLTTNTPVCENNDAEFYISGSPNSVLTYNINGNANQTITLNPSGNALIISPDVNSNTTINLISLQFNNANCSVNLNNTATVNVNPIPTLTSINNLIQCEETPVQTLNANDGITFEPNISVTWYDTPTEGNIVTNPTTNTINSPITFYAEITDTNTSCVNPNRQEVTLHIVSSPPSPNFNEVICSGQNLNVAINSFTATYTVVSSDPINVPPAPNRTTAIAENITDSYINTTENPVTITYTVTIDDQTACNGETFDVIVNVNPEPLNNTNPNDIICSGDPLNHDLTNDVNTPGTTFNWIADDNPNISGETISGGNNSTINDILTNTSGTTQNVVYTITPTSPNGCVGDPFVYTVTINPEPIVLPISGVSQLCIGEIITLTEGTSGSNVTWISSDTNIATIDANGNLTAINYGSVNITYVVTNDFGCNSISSPIFTIIVGPSTDTDGDGLTDCEETTGIDDPSTSGVPSGTSDPNNACSFTGTPIPEINNTTWQNSDCDGDGVTNGQEITDGTNPSNPCSYTITSISLSQSDPWLSVDCDGDGVINGQEVIDGTNPSNPCSYTSSSITLSQTGLWLSSDCDGDGVTNEQEISDGTIPSNPCSFVPNSITLPQIGSWLSSDCDGDGVTNEQEISDGTNPSNPCSYTITSISLSQSEIWLTSDCDGDGVTNGQEVNDGTNPSDPCSFISTSISLSQSGSWLSADCDGDGVLNEQEIIDGTNPFNGCSYNSTNQTLANTSNSWNTLDCDGDNVLNLQEVLDGTNPLDPCSVSNPIIPSTTNSNYNIWANEDCDGDGVTNDQEALDGTNPFDACSYNSINQVASNVSITWNNLDCDGDGETNEEEVNNGTNPSDPCSVSNPTIPSITDPNYSIWANEDCDGDGVTNGQEVIDETNPSDPCSYNSTNQIASNISTTWKNLDCDGDGETNEEEVNNGTNPSDPCSVSNSTIPSTTNSNYNIWANEDCDGDGVTNGQEVIDGTNPSDTCSYNSTSQITSNVSTTWNNLDCDGDGETNEEEVNNGTNPLDPCSTSNPEIPSTTNTNYSIWANEDCDGDGVTNGQEVIDGTNPFDTCSYNSTSQITPNVSTIWNNLDCDGDGVINGDELLDGTNPLDGCSYEPSSQEISNTSNSWNELDCDDDGLSNEEELNQNTDPLNPDSDGDGLTDGEEVSGIDDPNTPLDPTSFVEGPTSDPNDPCDPVEGTNCNNDECLNPYNLMSPDDGNTNNSVFFIKCIDNPKYANNTVEIFNRWGNTVFKIKGYSNTDSSKRFEGISNGRATITVDQKLPVGTYYYVIDPGNGDKPKTGWLYINR